MSKTDDRICGIYLIKNTSNGKCYVGSSVQITQRWTAHKSYLRRGVHRNKHLQAAWSKYGEDSFQFILIDRVADKQHLAAVEQTYIDYYRRYGIYNANPLAVTSLGRVASAETRAKISAGGRGLVRSQQTRDRIAAAKVGKPRSDETRERLSRTRRDPEVRLRLIEAQRARRRAIEQICLTTGAVLNCYESISAAAQAGFRISSLVAVAKGRMHQTGGFGWRYAGV